MAVPNNRVGIHFIKLTTITFDALVHLVIPNLNQDGDFQSSELFVMTLYCNKNVLLNVKNLSQIRWYSFSKKQSESQEMSPTNGLLHQKSFVLTIQLHRGSQCIIHRQPCLVQNSMVGNENDFYGAVMNDHVTPFNIIHYWTYCLWLRNKLHNNQL